MVPMWRYPVYGFIAVNLNAFENRLCVAKYLTFIWVFVYKKSLNT